MAKTTKLIYTSYTEAYVDAADECLVASSGWGEYDECMAPWEAGADAVQALRATTLALDVADSRRAFKAAGCAWADAITVVDAVAPVDLPAVKTALASRWKRKC